MPLAVGARLGPYEILSPIGEGGMGTVWKARDTRLDRTVAIKHSKDAFSERFEREARAISQLNHPHICQLYDIGSDYLVMEYIEGTPLKGPLPLEQAMKFAAQICEALDAAHSKGITHRDLKPANILVTRQGVKLLDFGLAKFDKPIQAAEETVTKGLTMKGQIVGTLSYMSPEQLQGNEASPRSDIFSFGCVLYEMLTGKRAFDGTSAASVIAAILERPAPSVAEVAPAALDRVLRRCLAKDPENRWRSARDLAGALECVSVAEPDTPVEVPPAARLPWIPKAAFAALAAIALALGFVAYRHWKEEPPRVLRVTILSPENTTLPISGVPALSPDGHKLAFAATAAGRTSLWVRDLDSLTARELPGTEGVSLPFWSPDSTALGFFAGGKLKRTNATGGSVLTICDAPNGRGGTWNQNDVIVFVPAILGPVFRVSAAGGTPSPLTKLAEDESAHRYPWFLPDGHHFLYLAIGSGSKGRVQIGDLESSDRKVIGAADSAAVYSPPGYLLFVRETTLLAQPFSLSQLQATGEPVVVGEQVSYRGLDRRALYTTSQTGILSYVPSDSTRAGNSQLTWIDRSGKPGGTVGTPASVSRPAISPDGTSVAAVIADPQTGSSDIWMYDLKRGLASRFTLNSQNNTLPVWSPDGSHLAFTSTSSGPTNIFQKSAAGGPDEAMESNPVPRNSLDWSRDGRYLIEHVLGKANEIWVLPLFGERKAFPYLQADFNQTRAKLSPNGRWLAYDSDQSKRTEIYVSSFPKPGGKWQVSTNGGAEPVWSRDGKELFFLAADGKMMAVEVAETANTFSPGVPKALFDSGIAPGSGYDVARDGRFLLPRILEQGGSAPLVVIVNWPAALKSK